MGLRSIRSTNFFITCIVGGLSLASFVCTIQSFRLRSLQERAYQQGQAALLASEQLGQGSHRLTSAVRAFAATGALEFRQDYYQELERDKNREAALQKSAELGLSSLEEQLLRQAKHHSDQLVLVEKQALLLAQEGRLKEASLLVYGPTYAEAKRQILSNLDRCRASIRQRTSQQSQLLMLQNRWLDWVEIALIGLNSLIMIGSLLFFYRRRVVEPLAAINADLRQWVKSNASNLCIAAQKEQNEVGEIARSLQHYLDTSLEAEREAWIRLQLSELSQNLLPHSDPAAFSQALLSHLAPPLGLGMAAFYLLDCQHHSQPQWRWQGSYGVLPADPPPSFLPGQGLVGQCGQEGRTLTFSQLPPHYGQRICSGVGQAAPRQLILAPIRGCQRILGVLELATFHPLTGQQRQLLEATCKVLTLHLEILYRQR